ncbi:MAG: chloride channel protein [Acidobacteriota bacterium]
MDVAVLKCIFHRGGMVLVTQNLGTGRGPWWKRARHAVVTRAYDEATRFFALMILTGIAGGFLPAGFHFLSRLLTRAFFLGGPGSLAKAVLNAPWWARLLVPAIGGLLAGLVRWALVPKSEGKARGFPEILEAVTMGAGILRIRRAVPMAISSLLTFSSGGSVGREGSIVQVASAIASWLGRKASLPRGRLRMMVACGVAAGLSAAYRTPMAGSLFALEVIYGRFAFDELGPIVVAAVLATATAYTLVGESPLYAVAQPFHMQSPVELGLYVLMGLASGVVAILFQRMLQGADDIFSRIPGPVPAKSFFGGLLVGLVMIPAPYVCGNGFEGLTEVLGGRTDLQFLLVLLAGKALATALTVGSGGAGGVFTPTLLIGATLGGSMGAVFHRELPAHTATAGAYALVGMGCLLAATTRAPIMAILMVFETTQQYSLILPLMLASIVSYAVARALHPDSIYTAELRRRGILGRERKADILATRTVGEIVRRSVPLVPQNLPLDTLLRIFRDTRELFLYVGDESGRLLGVIDLHDMKDFLDNEGLGSVILAADLVRPVHPIAATESLVVADYRLRDREVGQLPVVDGVDDAGSGRYVGVLTRRDLLAVVEKAMLLEETTQPMPTEEESRGRLAYVPMPDGLEGRRAIEVGEDAIGGEVLAIKRPIGDGDFVLLPAASAVLARGDVLVVMPGAALLK